MTRFSLPLLAALLGALCAVSPAQQVHVVDASGGGGSQYTEISDAVAAAVAGDVVEVRAGTYALFTVDKGISVIADKTTGVAQVSGGVRIENVPAGWPAVISGFFFLPGFPVDYGIEVRNNVGAVHLDDLIRNNAFGEGVKIHNNAIVSMRDCSITGYDIAMTVTQSALHMDGCTIAAGAQINGRQGSALQCDGSTVHAGSTLLHGGASSFYPGFESPGLHLISGTVCLGAGTTVAAGIVPPGFTLPVEAIFSEGGSIAMDGAAQLVPFGGSPATLGPATPVDTIVPAVHLEGASPGGNFAADILAPEGSTAVTFFGLASPPIALPFGTFWVAAPRVVVDVGAVPVGGERNALLPVPSYFPEGLSFAVQSVVIDSGSLYFSTPSVAVVRF